MSRRRRHFDPGGSDPASVDHGGSALEAGMIFQFRAVSTKDDVLVSSTEDLKGVFVHRWASVVHQRIKREGTTAWISNSCCLRFCTT